ncbi:MAG: hypothetical protein ABL973_20840 [Micropepsaceae bacterium]
MAVLYGANTTPRSTTPQGLVDGSLQGGHVRVYREKITLAGQVTADTIVLALPSAGETFLHGMLTSDVSLGLSQVSIGSALSPAKYRAPAVHALVDAPTPFAKTSAQGVKLATDEVVIMTIAAAALPASGTLIVDLYFTQS